MKCIVKVLYVSCWYRKMHQGVLISIEQRLEHVCMLIIWLKYPGLYIIAIYFHLQLKLSKTLVTI